LALCSDITLPPITDADDCYALLDDCDAHILYFYTHGHTRHRQADIGVEENLKSFISRYESLKKDDPRHELWKFLYESVKQDKSEPDSSWIELSYGKLELNELYGNISQLRSKPLVFLNMCESAQISPSLSDSFIDFFIDRGARGVIGTECPMTVEFAHPFSEKFLGGLLAGEAVGKALLNARSHFMKLKNPLGLAYTLFGSATACFQPAILKPLTMPATTNVSTVGILDQAIQAEPEKASSLEPQVIYSQAQMGAKEEVLELGKNIFDRWAVEAYKLACGSEDEDLEDRKQLITATGVSEVAIASAIAGLLISQLAVPAALAPVIAAIAVKRFFRPAYGEFCKIWKKNLPQVE